MYIAQAFNILHDWWRYVIGLVLVIVAVIIGQLPFTGVVFYKAYEQGINIQSLTETDMLSMLEPNLNLFLMLLTYAAGLVGVILAAKWLHNQSLRHLTTSRPKIDWKRFWVAFTIWGVISSGLILFDYFASPENYVNNFEWNRFLVLAAIAIALIPLQTSFEEYLFRGYLMQGIGVLFKNKWVPLILTSVIFGMLHFWNPEVDKLGNLIMIYYIGTGFFLGILTLMDEGLELALGFHAANNLFTALLVTANWTALQTHSVLKDVAEPELGFTDLIVPVFIMFPVLLFVFGKMYKWTNWKDKLFGAVVEPPQDNYKILEDSDLES